MLLLSHIQHVGPEMRAGNYQEGTYNLLPRTRCLQSPMASIHPFCAQYPEGSEIPTIAAIEVIDSLSECCFQLHLEKHLLR